MRLVKVKEFFITDCLCIAFGLFLYPKLIIERKICGTHHFCGF